MDEVHQQQRSTWSWISAAGDFAQKQQRYPDIQVSRRVKVFPIPSDTETDTDTEYQEEIDTFPLLQATKDVYTVSNFLTKLVDRIWHPLVFDLKEEFTYLFPMIGNPMTSYTEHNVRRTALISRLTLLIIQALACLTLPSHINDGFKTPAIDPTSNGSVDNFINLALGGLTNWDGQYFLHVAAEGYTHENTMAFFPLFPVSVGFLSKALHIIFFPILSFHSLTLVIGVIFNIWCFQNAAVALSGLVQIKLGNKSNSVLPTVIFLFCYNPASIFFSAFYSESLFAWLTFSCILELYKRNLERSIFYATLASVCRSNGLLNFGLIGIAALTQIATEVKTLGPPEGKFSLPEHWYKKHVVALRRIVRIGFMGLVGISPFICFQIYCVLRFCNNEQRYDIPEFCRYDTLPYTYIQKTNWNVGFLQYFEIKQIPNFVLAAPVLLTLGTGARRHAKIQKIELLEKLKRPRQDFYTEVLELALAWHSLFLTAFCLFCIHVQVSTRMIMSSCPLIYLYIAAWLNDERALFLRRLISWTPVTTFVQCWFSMYFLVGTVGFSLGYPWT